MTPERIAALVARWAWLYTRGLPAPIAERRIRELEADLHDHVAHARARGASDRRIAAGILSRMVRGLAADVSWRGRSVSRLVRVTACVLLVPLVAMQFTGEVAWTVSDFIFAGVLIYGTGRAYQLVAANAGGISYRAALGLALAAAFILVWTVGAVGVIGEEGDRADLMFGGVLAVGVVGAFVARFRPHGMSRALLATAAAQALVAVIALIAGKHHDPVTSVAEILALNAFFCALFIGSAWLFRHAARPVTPGTPPTVR
jgi:hypothetical protein